MEARTLQTHHAYSALKRRGNGSFHVVSTWNTRGVFIGNEPINMFIRGNDSPYIETPSNH